MPIPPYGHLQFHKDSNPNFFIRSERCYPLHHRTILHPLKDSNFYLRFWRPICYHCTKEMFVGICGFEPQTFDVSGQRSNQLSYIPMLQGKKDSNLHDVLLPKQAAQPLAHYPILWEWRDSNPQCCKTTDLQSAKQPLLNTPKFPIMSKNPKTKNPLTFGQRVYIIQMLFTFILISHSPTAHDCLPKLDSVDYKSYVLKMFSLLIYI